MIGFAILCMTCLSQNCVACDPLTPATRAAATTTHATPGLMQTFEADFDKDCRQEWQMAGAITWQPGQLFLPADASLTKEIDGSWLASWHLAFAPAQTQHSVSTAPIRFAVTMGAAPNWQLQWKPLESGSLQVQLYQDFTNNAHLSEPPTATSEDLSNTANLIRAVEIQAPWSDTWQIEYRLGVVTVWLDKKQVLLGYLENRQGSIRQCRLSTRQPIHLTGWHQQIRLAKHFNTEQKAIQTKFNQTYRQASKLFTAQQFTQAETLFQECLQLAEQLYGSDHPNYAILLHHMAGLQLSQNRLDAAATLYQRCLQIREQHLGENHPELAATLHNLALLYFRQQDFVQAEHLFERSANIFSQQFDQDHPKRIACLSGLAQTYQSLGKLGQVEPLYRQIIASRERTLGPDHLKVAEGWIMLASLYCEQGYYKKAESLYQLALAIQEEKLGIGHEVVGRYLQDLALVYQKQGKLPEAEQLYLRSLEIFETQLGAENSAVAHSLHELAGLYYNQDKLAAAELLLWRGLQLRERLLPSDHPDLAFSYNNLAALYYKRKQFREAELQLLRPLQNLENRFGRDYPLVGTIYRHLGTLYQDQEQFAAAESALERSVDIFSKQLGPEHPFLIESLRMLARGYCLQGRYSEAITLLQRIIAIQEKFNLLVQHEELLRSLNETSYRPHHDLAFTQITINHWADAWQSWENGLSRGLLGDWLLRQERDLTAAERLYQQHIQQRCRSLHRLLQASTLPHTETNAQREKWQQEWRQQTTALLQWQEKLGARLAPSKQRSVSWQEIQTHLQPHQALIGWLNIGYNHYAAVLRATGAPQWVTLPDLNAADPYRDAEHLANLLASNSPRHLTRQIGPAVVQLRQLYLMRMLPLLDATATLPAATHWIVLPSASLQCVPVELLAPSPVQISYCSSGSILTHLRRRRSTAPNTGGILALGDPNFYCPPERSWLAKRGLQLVPNPTTTTATIPNQPNLIWGLENWSALPGTRSEVEELFRLACQADIPIKTLLGSSASEQVLYQLARSGELKTYRYLHFATHGQADSDYPLQSRLILSRDALPDPIQQFKLDQPVFRGELTAETILRDWELDADLVVLSACQTGFGKLLRSEGYLGLVQPLFLAGARSAIVSLWNVNDTATQLLMLRFYQNLWGLRPGFTAPMSKVAALHEAKQWLQQLTYEEILQLRQQPAGMLSAPTQPKRSSSEPVPTTVNKEKPPIVESVNVVNDPNLGSTPSTKNRPFASPQYWAAFVLVGDWE